MTGLYARFLSWWAGDPVVRQLVTGNFSRLGLAALTVAERELGRGETLANNEGPDLDRYRAGGAKGPWCAALVYYCLLMGARHIGWRLPFKRTHGARRLFLRCVKAGARIKLDDIKPGDIVCWGRGPRGGWQAHIGIVHWVKRVGGHVVEFHHIAGNEGAFPAKVAIHKDSITRGRLIGFARLP